MPPKRAWTLQQTSERDRSLISGLVAAARWKHLHLDWIQPQDLLARKPFLLATESGLPVCCLGCPPDQPGSAWIRIFAVASGYRRSRCWDALWPAARDHLEAEGVTEAAVLLTAAWLEPLLQASGFSQSNEVIFLEWEGTLPPFAGSISDMLRPMQEADLSQVLKTDHRAFGPLWRFSMESLAAARRLAFRSSVLELEGEIVGYQITTVSALGAHLARVAVDPDRQGHGLGRALVAYAAQLAIQHGHHSLSVNTQADNTASRKLYRSLGFRETGQRFPVYFLALPGL